MIYHLYTKISCLNMQVSAIASKIKTQPSIGNCFVHCNAETEENKHDLVI